MTHKPAYHYRMACGHNGHKLDADGYPYCAVCIYDRPADARKTVGTVDDEPRRRTGGTERVNERGGLFDVG